jgi:multiple RNA-binding domain-containing protein 1
VVLPATKTLALVEFTDAMSARKAFKACAYKKVNHIPIYLEWAPQGQCHQQKRRCSEYILGVTNG